MRIVATCGLLPHRPVAADGSRPQPFVPISIYLNYTSRARFVAAVMGKQRAFSRRDTEIG